MLPYVLSSGNCQSNESDSGLHWHTAIHQISQGGVTGTIKVILELTNLDDWMRLLTNEDVYCYRTAMHWAALHGRTKTVDVILHYLTPEQLLHVFSLCDKDGQTALQLAGNNDHHQLIYMFHQRAKQHVSKKMNSTILFFNFA